MKHKSILVVVAITLGLSAVLVATWNFTRPTVYSPDQREGLETDLDLLIESYKAGKVDVIDISTITPFAWEELYLFGPYSSKKYIAEVTGIKGLGNLRTTIESNDGIVLFVFVNQDKIVQYMDYYRYTDFVDSVRESGYSPSEANFVLDEKGRAVPKSP